MTKRIAILTAGHLSSCPRLIKEAELLSKNGYAISIVYLNSIPRIAKLDYSYIDQHKDWDFHEVKWDNSFETFTSRLYFRLFNLFGIRSKYVQSSSKKLIDKIVSIKADLYIAHHPSVLVAASIAAAKYKSKYAYDIEDAFAFVEDGRYLDNPDLNIQYLESKYIKDTCYTSTASPLYAEVYKQLYKIKKSPINLLNVFNINKSPVEYSDRKDLQKVSFYWYSQTVGLNRGLQDLFMAVNRLKENSFELHIRGTCTNEVKQTLMNLLDSELHKTNIFFHNTVNITELSQRNKEHDIGFALETATSLNRDLCISNKILDYLCSGLMIVATNTSGHKYITNELGEHCIAYNEKDIDALTKSLQIFIDNKELIANAKSKSIELAKMKYNWNLQSANYLKKVVNELNQTQSELR